MFLGFVVLPYLGKLFGARAQDKIAREQATQDAEEAALLAQEAAAAAEIEAIQIEINRLAIEKTKEETRFDVEEIERQMEERLAVGRARRGVSGLTAEGSPIMVRQYLAEQYEKMTEYREKQGEFGVDVLEYQRKIGAIETELRIAGIEFETTQFETRQRVRGMEQQYQQFASILDMGTDWLSFGYGMKKTQIPGAYKPELAVSSGYKYGGFS